MKNNIAELEKLLSEAQDPSVVITTHHKPDADALGSSLGLYNYFTKKGIKAQVITPTDYPDFLKWMPGNSTVINFEEYEAKSAEIVNAADFVFCLDFNTLKRINALGEIVEQASATKVMIDHHQNPGDFAEYVLWTTKASSTCELIYQFIKEMGDEDLVDEYIANCLMAGMIADTGSFKFDSTTANTFRIAAELTDKGADTNSIQTKLFDNNSVTRTKLMGFATYERLEILEEYNTALMYLSADDLKRFNVKTGDTEGFANIGLGIKGIKLSALIIDRTVLVKMSFRVKGDFPAHEFSAKYFKGGGHQKASGGQSELSLEETIAKFKEALKEYKDYLK